MPTYDPYNVSVSAYDPTSPYYNPNALGNRPLFMPGGMGTGQPWQSQWQSPYVQQYVQPSYYTGYGTAPTVGFPSPLVQYLQNMQGQGAITPLTQLLTQYGYPSQTTSQLLYPMTLMEQQYALRQRGLEKGIEEAKKLAKEYGLDPQGAASMAERLAAVKSLPIQQTLDAAIRTIENQYARGGASLGTGYDSAIAEALGAAQAAAREQRVLAETQLIPNALQMLLRTISAMSI